MIAVWPTGIRIFQIQLKKNVDVLDTNTGRSNWKNQTIKVQTYDKS